MKIIHITTHHLFLGGGERLGFNWVENSKHPSTYYSRKGGIDYAKSKRFKTYRDDKELREVIERHQNDTIVVHDPFISRENYFDGCRCLVWYVHGAFPFSWDISGFTKPNLVLSNYLPKVKHPSWNQLPTFANQLGVDGTQFKAPTRTPKTKTIIVGIVGRISEEKIPLYFFEFIKKFNRTPRHRNGYEFRFFGKGITTSLYYNEFVKRVNEIPNVKYMGEVDKSLIQRTYQSLDILVVPSLSETGSYAIVEAQLCGLRVLSLDADGMPNHIHGTSRLCVDYDDMFNHLSAHINRDGIATRRKQSISAGIRFSLDNWVRKLDKLVEIANL